MVREEELGAIVVEHLRRDGDPLALLDLVDAVRASLSAPHVDVDVSRRLDVQRDTVDERAGLVDDLELRVSLLLGIELEDQVTVIARGARVRLGRDRGEGRVGDAHGESRIRRALPHVDRHGRPLERGLVERAVDRARVILERERALVAGGGDLRRLVGRRRAAGAEQREGEERGGGGGEVAHDSLGQCERRARSVADRATPSFGRIMRPGAEM